MVTERGVNIQNLISFQEIAEILPQPLLVIDSGLVIRYQNPAFQRLKLLEELHSLHDLLRTKQASDLQKYYQQALQGEQAEELAGQAFQFQLRVGQRKYYFRATSCLLLHEDQTLLALFLEDQTNFYRQRRKKLNRSKQFHSILDNTGAVIYIKDNQGRYQFVNELFEKLFHISRQDVVGKTDYDIFEASYASRFQEIDQQVIRSGNVFRGQEVAEHDDGPHTYISVKFPLRDVQGRITGLAGISTDITEQLQTEQEIDAALAVQQLLYPEVAPQIPGFEMAGHVLASQTAAGDYYDFIEVSPDRIIVAVGDVSGHGLGPALEMVETRSYLRAILRTEVRLDTTLNCLNQFLCRDLRDCAFVTLFLAEIDTQKQTFRYASAGHQAHLIHQNGESQLLMSTGLMLGIEPKTSYTCSETMPLIEGDLLLIATDGITEAMTADRNLWGVPQMLERIHATRHLPAQQMVEELIETARQLADDGPMLRDDMTAVIVKSIS